METQDQEIEVKFYICNLDALARSLEDLGARLEQPRTLELNLRYDTPDGDLTKAYQVLRLRYDTAARLTFKGPARGDAGTRVRQEIEFTVGDFQAARRLLEALGYAVLMIYEKYRTGYELNGLHIALDELPYGNFLEIEGPNPASIQELSQKLDLDWEAGVPESYVALFERLRQVHHLPSRDLTFANFEGLQIQPQDLNAWYADG